MRVRKGVCLSVLLFLGLCAVLISSASALDVNNVLIKLTLHQGESAERVFSVSSEEAGSVMLTLQGVRGVSLGQSSLMLNAGESRDVTLYFASSGLVPGLYVGSLALTSDKETDLIPIILEVESSDSLFDVNLDIPPIYKEVFADEKIIPQIKVFDLTSGGTSNGLGPSRVTMDYYIYSLEGELVSSQSEEIVVDRQTQLTKTFSFPSDLLPGDYVLGVRASYLSSVGLGSSLFSIKPAKSTFFPSGSFDLTIVYLLVAFLLFFAVIVCLFMYFVRDRDKLVVELRRYHEEEMKHMQHFLSAQGKLLAHKKTVSPQAIAHSVDQKLRALSHEQRQRERQLLHFKDKGNVSEMQRKLVEWKQKGYDTRLLEYKLKGLTTGEMKTLLSHWKRKYGAEGYKK